jgi:hypothetical protein
VEGKGYLKNNMTNTYFSKSIKKYGWENFEHRIIIIVDKDNEDGLIEELNNLELKYIEMYNSFYPNGYNTIKGYKGTYIVSDEVKKRISDKKKGQRKTPEQRMKQSEIQKSLNFKHSEETRMKMSKSAKERHKRKPMSDETKKKISDSRIKKIRNGSIVVDHFRGHSHTEESKEKIRKSLEGCNIYTEERNEKISRKLKGRSFSEETRKKLSESQKGSFYVTDGNVKIRLRKDSEIPEGFHLVKKVSNKNVDKK